MNDTPQEQNKISERPPTGSLIDFVEGVNKENPLDLEVSVDDRGRVIIFYDKKFTEDVSWFEYEVSESKLNFILGEGEIRDIGLPLAPAISKHMQNSHQILMVHIDDETGEAHKGDYIPLIIHQF
ncbi:MAG: hypothetical protein AAF182_01880 [Pseudomonadota bacterium]